MPRYQPVIPACRTGLASRLVPALLALGVAVPASAQLPLRDVRANTAAVMQQGELIGVMATYDEAKLRADQTAIWAAAKVKEAHMPLQRKPLEELDAAAANMVCCAFSRDCRIDCRSASRAISLFVAACAAALSSSSGLRWSGMRASLTFAAAQMAV